MMICGIRTSGTIFAAVFGSYLGINLRLFLERRKFQREAASG